MPKYKLTDKNRKKLLHVKAECPCITKALIAYIFDLSPSRVGEIIREEEERVKTEQHNKFMSDWKPTIKSGFDTFAETLETIGDEE
jgi:hypothetical protein